MINSYEQFKAVTANIFNSKAKSLNVLRETMAKSLGFKSSQALKENLENKDTKLSSNIVLIEVASGVVLGVTSFENSDNGMIAAKKLLKEIIEDTCEDEPQKVEEALNNCYWEKAVDEITHQIYSKHNNK